MTHRGKWIKKQAQRYLDYKDTVAWTAKPLLKTPIRGEVGVKISVYYSSRKTADLDNILKAVLDGLNNIAWEDDRQIAKIVAERYIDSGEDDRVEVHIWRCRQKKPEERKGEA